MDHKEMCANWVEDRKEEADIEEWWEIDPHTFERLSGPYKTEEALNDVLWPKAFDHAHEVFIP